MSEKSAQTEAEELGVEIQFDPYAFTSNEMGEVEDLLNCEFQQAIDAMSGVPLTNDDGQRVRYSKVMRAFQWVNAKRNNPALTLEEAGDLPLSQLVRPV